MLLKCNYFLPLRGTTALKRIRNAEQLYGSTLRPDGRPLRALLTDLKFTVSSEFVKQRNTNLNLWQTILIKDKDKYLPVAILGPAVEEVTCLDEDSWADGDTLIYNGGRVSGKSMLAKCKVDNSLITGSVLTSVNKQLLLDHSTIEDSSINTSIGEINLSSFDKVKITCHDIRTVNTELENTTILTSEGIELEHCSLYNVILNSAVEVEMVDVNISCSSRYGSVKLNINKPEIYEELCKLGEVEVEFTVAGVYTDEEIIDFIKTGKQPSTISSYTNTIKGAIHIVISNAVLSASFVNYNPEVAYRDVNKYLQFERFFDKMAGIALKVMLMNCDLFIQQQTHTPVDTYITKKLVNKFDLTFDEVLKQQDEETIEKLNDRSLRELQKFSTTVLTEWKKSVMSQLKHGVL